MTNVGHDVADWYTINWTDNTKTNYLFDKTPIKASLRTEVYKIKGKPDVLDTVRTTVWGPIVYPADTTGRKDLAFHWIANELPEIDLHYLRQLVLLRRPHDRLLMERVGRAHPLCCGRRPVRPRVKVFPLRAAAAIPCAQTQSCEAGWPFGFDWERAVRRWRSCRRTTCAGACWRRRDFRKATSRSRF